MNRIKAFTLVELLVAIAIFAVLSALGWKTFDYLSKVKDRNIVKEEQLEELQFAYQQVLKDSIQIVPVNSNINLQIEPALSLQNGRITFNKIGVTDPLLQGTPPTERVEYRYDESAKIVYRLRYKNINQNANAQPESSILLNNVEAFQVTVLKPEELSQWPEQVLSDNEKNTTKLRLLPRGMKIRFTYYQDDYEWVFSLLNTSYLDKDQNNNSSNNGENQNDPNINKNPNN